MDVSVRHFPQWKQPQRPTRALQTTAAAPGFMIFTGIYYVIRFGHVPIRRLWLSSGRYAAKSGTLMALCANLRMRAANGGIASLLQSTRLVAAVAELGPLIVT